MHLYFHFSRLQLSIGALFPEWKNHSWEDIRRIALRWRSSNAAARAAAAAGPHFQTHPEDRIRLDEVWRDFQTARSLGLLSMLRGRQKQNKDVVQPNVTIPPPSMVSQGYIPPYPTQSGMQMLNSFHCGGDIILPAPLPQQMVMRPKSVADHLAMERLIADEHRKGWVVVLPRKETEQLCAEASLPSLSSPSFISKKTDVDPIKEEMGRRTDDYSISGMNTLTKRKQLRTITGPYDDPTEVDICQTIVDAAETYPGQPIFLLKTDYSSYFRRFPINVQHALLLSIHLVIDEVEYMAIPLFGPFGLQDSNAVALCATEAMHSINATYHLNLHGKVLQTTFLDDTVAAAPYSVLIKILSFITDTAIKVIGPNGISIKKTFIDRIMVVLGFQYDCHNMTISITTVWYEKLISAIFDDLPTDPQKGDTVRLRIVQKVAAHMLRTARLTTSMLSFSRALYRNIRGVVDHDYAVVHLTERSVQDILQWRDFLQRCFMDARPLTVPITMPILMKRRRGESKEAFWTRQASAAHDIVHVDACTHRPDLLPRDCWGAGWIARPNINTITIPITAGAEDLPVPDAVQEAYGAYDIDRLDFGGLPVKFKDQINVYEFLASLIAITALALQGRPTYVPEGTKWHVHIWTDNTSALSWLTSYKSAHPLIIRLLHTFSSVQEQHNMVVTSGYVKGTVNRQADAASRGFHTPCGFQLLQQLSHLTPHSALPEWWQQMLQV